MDATRIFDMVGSDLEKVQARIQECLTSHVGIVDRLGRYVGENTGKKLRPALLVLAGRMVKAPEESLPVLGALVELLHTASLVHDDIIDEAATRRGRPSVNSAFGNQMSVLLGDWMYMTAFQVAVNQQSFRILDLLLDVTRKMVEGELIQQELLGKVETTAAESLDIAARKTAYLFSASTALPGVAAGRSLDEQDRLARIGLNLGLAFQLVDDILDYTADERKLGKPIMNDLREGKLTLPVIYLLDGRRPGAPPDGRDRPGRARLPHRPARRVPGRPAVRRLPRPDHVHRPRLFRCRPRGPAGVRPVGGAGRPVQPGGIHPGAPALR